MRRTLGFPTQETTKIGITRWSRLIRRIRSQFSGKKSNLNHNLNPPAMMTQRKTMILIWGLLLKTQEFSILHRKARRNNLQLRKLNSGEELNWI